MIDYKHVTSRTETMLQQHGFFSLIGMHGAKSAMRDPMDLQNVTVLSSHLMDLHWVAATLDYFRLGSNNR